jgi:hypothetical protein
LRDLQSEELESQRPQRCSASALGNSKLEAANGDEPGEQREHAEVGDQGELLLGIAVRAPNVPNSG